MSLGLSGASPHQHLNRRGQSFRSTKPQPAPSPAHIATRSVAGVVFALTHPTLIPGLGLLRCQMLLEFLHLRIDHQLAVSLGRIFGEIVLVVVFCRIEML